MSYGGTIYIDSYSEVSTSGLTWTSGHRQSHSYDELDRLTRTEAYNGVDGNYGPQVYAYDAGGDITYSDESRRDYRRTDGNPLMEPSEPILLFDGTRDRWVFSIPLIFIGLFMVREGLRLQRRGRMKKTSFAYRSELRRVNIVTALLGRPQVQDLSPQYIRSLGAGEALLGICLVIVALWQILRHWI